MIHESLENYFVCWVWFMFVHTYARMGARINMRYFPLLYSTLFIIIIL